MTRENARVDGTDGEISAELTVEMSGETLILRFDPTTSAAGDSEKAEAD